MACGGPLWVVLVLRRWTLGYHLGGLFVVEVCEGMEAYLKVHGGPAPQCAVSSRLVEATAQAAR